jgi:hypothetical protein
VLDIPSVSSTVAAAGVLVGVVLTVLELRHFSKQRQTELVVELSSQTRSREYKEASMDALSAEFKDYNDFVKKYGAPFSKNPVPVSFSIICTFYEQLGVLVRNKLIDPHLVSQLFSVALPWRKLKPIVEGMRKEYNEPRLYEWFEYLYNEMQKREQQLKQKGVMNG